MDWGSPTFVLAIIALSYGCWMVNNWIRAKHGYPLEDEMGGKSERIESTETAKLKAEHNELHSKLDAMQDRMIVLEKIVTDRGYTLSDEIEALRDKPFKNDSGTPLNIENKEKA